jgi:hypothetical protein
MENDLSSYILVKSRDLEYKLATKQIISKFEERLQTALQSLFKTQRSMIFTDVSLLPNIENYVYVSGYLELIVGDIVLLNNKEIILDETNINSYKNQFKITISTKTLDSGEPKEILDNINDIQRLQSVLSADDLVEYLKNTDDLPQAELVKSKKYDDILNKITKPKSIDVFDVSNLTDSQISQLVYFMPKETGKAN